MKYRGSICPKCFEDGYSRGVCPHCGYRDSFNSHSGRALVPGTILKNRYMIGVVLGEGGFGITYKACDIQGGGICTVKEYAPVDFGHRLQNGTSMSPMSARLLEPYQKGLERFASEAKLLYGISGVRSEVARVFDFFCENNTAYYVMEYLDGADLEKILRVSGRLSYEDATGVIAGVARAMGELYRKSKILHRDISPDNIIVTRDTRVKIIDFGSAKQEVRQQNQNFSVVLKRKYAPLEQFGSVMPQGSYTDVYALAATYYYALTGSNIPEAPDRLGGVGYRTLVQCGIGVPQSVSDAVDRALVINYRDRTQTMDEFADGILSGSGRRSQTSGAGTGRQSSGTTGHGIASAGTMAVQIWPYLLVRSGPMTGQKIRLQPNTGLVIGRSKVQANITLVGYPNVSRTHCTVFYDSGTGVFYLRDSASAYGTTVERKLLNKGQTYRFSSGTVVVLADSCVLYFGTEAVRQ